MGFLSKKNESSRVKKVKGLGNTKEVLIKYQCDFRDEQKTFNGKPNRGR